MSRIDRREFLAATGAVIAGAAGPVGGRAMAVQPAGNGGAVGDAHRGPCVISSGNGERAAARAMERIRGGGHPLDAIVEGIGIVEDDPNDMSVGLGGLPNEEGVVQLDASVMDGLLHRAGSVAALENIRNPAAVALLVSRLTDHVMLVGPGASKTEIEAFRKRLVNDPDDFIAQPTRFDAPKAAYANVRNVVVYNGLSWSRSDIVRIDPPPGRKIVAVRHSTRGSAIPFDIDADGAVVFVAAGVPSMGYVSFEVTTATGKPVPTLIGAAARSVGNARYSVRLRADGNVESIRDLSAGREIVNNKGERPFNDLLRLEGSDASVVSYPAAPVISVEKGRIFSRLTVRRERSIYPPTTLTIYNDLDRVEIHNELDPKYDGFIGGNNNWGDTYYFAFPFNVSKAGLQVLRGGHKWFDKLPDDYLPGARRDSVTTRHAIGMTDGRSTAVMAHRQAFHWAFPSYVATKVLAKGAPKEFPAMYMGKFPLPEATVYSRAIRNASEADTHDKGVIYMDTVEPGLTGNYIYDFALSSQGVFDPVAGWRLGADFNLPLIAKYTQIAPAVPNHSFFSIDQSNVQIVDVKPVSDNVIRGEVSSAPLDPPRNREFIMRLQEFAGKAARVRVTMPAAIKAASLVSMTEDKTIGNVDQIAPLTVSLRPFQTATIKVVID